MKDSALETRAFEDVLMMVPTRVCDVVTMQHIDGRAEEKQSPLVERHVHTSRIPPRSRLGQQCPSRMSEEEQVGCAEAGRRRRMEETGKTFLQFSTAVFRTKCLRRQNSTAKNVTAKQT